MEDEKIRLKCLKFVLKQKFPPPSGSDILNEANYFYDFVRNGVLPLDKSKPTDGTPVEIPLPRQTTKG